MNKFATNSPARCLLLAAGLLILNCATLTQAAAAGPAKLPAETLLAEIKTTPYAERAALRAKVKTAEGRFADRLPEWNARKNSLPEKERLAAEPDFKQLERMREILRQKIDGVEFAEEATWTSAKHDLSVALDKTIRTFKKLSARFDN